MPRGSPFTALCQLAAALSRPVVADLHTHTTMSDGDYTPSQVVALARRARLTALAVTDHDTVAAVGPAREAAVGSGLVIVPGVECSAAFGGGELHILGYFIDPTDAVFLAHLGDVQARRRVRFETALAQLRAGGVAFPPGAAERLAARTPSLGRRHLAGLLVEAGAAESRSDAFGRVLRSLDPPVPPVHLTDAAEVIARIHAARGVASLAHPPRDFPDADFIRLKEMGLDAVEAHCPSTGGGREKGLVETAGQLGLAVTGGSDCHGPPPAGHARPRSVGTHGLNHSDWSRLKTAAAAHTP